LLTEAAESLLATEPVRKEVQAQVQAKIAEEVLSSRNMIEEALAGLKEQLSGLQDSLESKRTEVAGLDTELQEKRLELEATVASFDRAVEARLEEIARRPEAFFAEAAVLRSALARAVPTAIAENNRAEHTGRSVRPTVGVSPDTEEFALLNDSGAVGRSLTIHASADGLSLQAMLGLHGVFAAGMAPVVAGSRGYDLLRAYAAAVAGGRLHWIPIGSGTMEPHDLLGRFDPLTRRILPSPSGLLDVVRDGMHTGRLHVVVLEGFNRAPTEAYLSPILEAAHAGRVGDVLRAIPLAHAGLLADNDEYGDVARLVWPPSVVIACLPTEGTVTLPVPQSVWSFLALLDADDRDRLTVPLDLATSDGAAHAEIDPTLWRDTVITCRTGAAGDGDEATALARALSLTARDTADAVRLREVLRLNGLPLAEATAMALEATLIPRSTRDATVMDESTKVIGVTLPGWRTVWAEAQRLRS
jgi:hypothetical protein